MSETGALWQSSAVWQFLDVCLMIGMCARTGRYDARSSATPEPIFWTPGLAAQMTPSFGADTGVASVGRGLDGFAGASAAESQQHALSSQLGTLQAATQKGSNRCCALHASHVPHHEAKHDLDRSLHQRNTEGAAGMCAVTQRYVPRTCRM